MDWRRIPSEVTVMTYSRLEKRLYAPARNRLANFLRTLRAENRTFARYYWRALHDAQRYTGFRP